MEELVISFEPNGRVESVFDERFSLVFLGKQKIYRQTDITYDSDTDTWDVAYLADGARHEVMHGIQSYEAAKCAEVEWLNYCREISIHPLCQAGRNMARLAESKYR